MQRVSRGSSRPFVVIAFVLLVLAAATATAETRVLTIYFHGTGSGLEPGVVAYPGATATLYLNDPGHALQKTSEIRDCLPLGSRVVTSVWTTSDYSHYRYSVEGIATPMCASEFVDPDWGPRGWSVATGEALMAIRAAMNANPDDTWILNLVGHSRGGVLAMTTARAAVSATDVEPKIEKINILAYDPVPGCGDPIGRLGSSFRLPSKVSQYVALYAKHHMQFSFEPVIPERESASTTMWMSVIPGSHTDLAGALDYRRDIAAVGMAIAVQLLSSPNWGSVGLPGFLSSIDDGSEFASFVNAIARGDYTGAMNDGGFAGFSWLVPCNDDGLIRADTLSPWRQLNDRLAFVAPERHGGHNAPWWCGFIWINVEKVFWLKERVRDLAPGDWTTLQSLRGEPPPDTDPPVPVVDPLPPIVSSCPVTLVRPTASDTISGSILATTNDPLTYSTAGTYTVTWTYTDAAHNSATQTQTVTVTADGEAPDLDVPPGITRVLDASSGGPWVVISPEDLGTAKAGDSCGPPTIERSGVPPGNRYPPGVTTIRYAATDVWGNTGVAYQTVTVAITAPPDVSATTPPDATSCEAVVSDAELGAIAPIPGLTVTRVPAGNVFPLGTTTVTWTASDGSGHSASATQTVTVVDATPPRITAPAAVRVFTGPDTAGCEVVLDEASCGTPAASDTCALASVVPSGIPAGNAFPVGTTTITWTATDA
ncbi:MAG TPA: HYR domain-containing protein, partial [Thermoanaerobaculia bacterium]